MKTFAVYYGLAVVNQKKTTIFGLSTKVKRYMHLAASCFLPIRENLIMPHFCNKCGIFEQP